jgi:uncharacterized membrane protein
MAEEFSCEFCKAEFKDNSRLQRHIKTSKKCIAKRTPTETVSVETTNNDNSDRVSQDDLLTKYNEALKELEEKKKEIDYIKEEYIKLSKYNKDREVQYKVRMICSCGVLRVMEKERLKQILDETGNVIFKVDDNPDKFERDILITMTRMK